jgi:hypothetical protein
MSGRIFSLESWGEKISTLPLTKHSFGVGRQLGKERFFAPQGLR